MRGLITGIHVFVSILLILAILLHQPQRGGLSVFLGGGGEFFGGRGAAPFLTKTVIVLGIIFGITTFTLAFLYKTH